MTWRFRPVIQALGQSFESGSSDALARLSRDRNERVIELMVMIGSRGMDREAVGAAAKSSSQQSSTAKCEMRGAEGAAPRGATAKRAAPRGALFSDGGMVAYNWMPEAIEGGW
jgi:hypothetical protein